MLATTAACFYDFDRHAPTAEATTKVRDARADTHSPTIDSGPTVTDDDAGPDADVPPIEAGPRDCPTQDVSWNVSSASCTTSSVSVLLDGQSRVITDSQVTDTGTVKITCNAGVLQQSEPLCEPPKAFDVSGPSACVLGYCDATALSGVCGAVANFKASLICQWKGYADQVSYTTEPGPGNATVCGANGQGCYTSQNPTCNPCFATVTCRH
jgi:hypothetical protein